MSSLRTWIGCVIVVLFAGAVSAQEWIVIVDLRTSTLDECKRPQKDLNARQAANVSYSFPASTATTIRGVGADKKPEPLTLVQLLNCGAGIAPAPGQPDPCEQLTLPTCTTGGGVQPLRADFALYHAIEVARDHIAATSARWVSERGDTVHIYVISDASVEPKVNVKEEKRKSQFATDLNTLLKVISQITVGAADEPRRYAVSVYRYRLVEERANLTIRAFIEADEEAETPERAAEAKLVTGPAEHLFLSADVPLSSGEQLQYDDENSAIVTREDPSAVYVGLNFKVGDLFRDDGPFWQKIVIKGLVAASKRPADGWGVGIGLRGDFLGRYGIDLNTFSPFVAWTSIRSDVPEEKRGDTAKRTNSFRFGVSFNLDKAVEWLKPKDDSDGEDEADTGDDSNGDDKKDDKKDDADGGEMVKSAAETAGQPVLDPRA